MKATRPKYAPVELFERDAFCAEHPPSVERIRAMQEAAQAEALDEDAPLAARLHNLRRMKKWIDELIARIDEGEPE